MMRRENVVIDFEQEPPCKVPVYFNKYAMENERGGEPMRERESKEREFTSRPPSYRSQSMPRQGPRYGDRLMPPGGRGIVDDDHEMMEPQPTKGRKRERPGELNVPLLLFPLFSLQLLLFFSETTEKYISKETLKISYLIKQSSVSRMIFITLRIHLHLLESASEYNGWKLYEKREISAQLSVSWRNEEKNEERRRCKQRWWMFYSVL